MATIRTSDSQSIYDLKYPGALIDAILDTAYDLQNAGYIFRGPASEYSNTPTERSWVLAGEGETGHGFTSPVPKGYIGVCVFNGTFWTCKLLKCVSIDSTPTNGSTNAVSSGGAYASISQLADTVNEALDNLTFTDTTPSAFLGEYITEKVSTTDGGIERILTYFTILAATTSKAGLLSAADKAKLDAILGNLRSLEIEDTTAYADLGDKIVDSIKATIGGTEETISTFQLLAATASKAGLLSAADKAKLDAILGNLRSLEIEDTTAYADLGDKIVDSIKATIGGTEETISTFQLLAATASKAGLLSAADKAKLDALWSSGYQFAGIATPSTTPVNTTSKIFYIATEAGTYFNAVTVTKGINILSWNGSTWSAVQVVGIDDEPTAGSSNLVSSEGLSKVMSVLHKGLLSLLDLEPIEVTRGGSIALNGDTCNVNAVSNPSDGYAVVPCQEGDEFTLVLSKRPDDSTRRVWGFIDTPNESGVANVLYKMGSALIYAEDRLAVAPEGATYAVFNIDLNYPFLIYKGSGKGIISEKDLAEALTGGDVMIARSNLSASSDMNTLITGFYRKTVTTVPTNWPTELDDSTWWNVINYNRDANFITQIFTNTNNAFIRTKVGDNWGAMIRLNTADLLGIVGEKNFINWDDKDSYSVYGNVGETIQLGTSLAKSHFLLNVEEGDFYYIQVRTSHYSSEIHDYVVFTDDDDIVVANDVENVGFDHQVFAIISTTVPAGATRMYVNSNAFINNVVNVGKTRVFTVSQKDLQTQIDDVKEAVELLNETDIPKYYYAPDGEDEDSEYITTKLDRISYIQEHINKNCDSFFYLTDYHYHRNQKNSPALLKYIMQRTGISKLFFAGDIGTSSASPYVEAHRAGIAYDDLERSVTDFFGSLGNHEWNHNIVRDEEDPIQSGTYSIPGVMNFYVARHKRTADGMDANTYCYYVDNKVNKVRYFFVHTNSGAQPIVGATAWLANTLRETPDGYAVVLIVHNAYISQNASYYQCDRWIGDDIVGDVTLSNILNAFNTQSTITVGGVTYDYSQTNGTVVGIFSGHHHCGCLYDKNGTYIQLEKVGDEVVVVRDGEGNPVLVGNTEGVNVFQGSTDSLLHKQGGIDGYPWFWKDFSVTIDDEKQVVVNGEQIKRTAGTYYEQCFYVVQIDLHAKHVYITAIGGDRDFEFDY